MNLALLENHITLNRKTSLFKIFMLHNFIIDFPDSNLGSFALLVRFILFGEIFTFAVISFFILFISNDILSGISIKTFKSVSSEITAQG